MIHMGMPTLIEAPSPKASIDLCHRLGLQFIELNMNLPQFQLDKLDVDELKVLSKGDHPYFTIHLDENLNVADFNTAVAQAYLNTVLDTIQLAKHLQTPVLNMHLSKGVYFTLPDRKIFLFQEYKERYLDRIRFFRDACDHAVGNDPLLICIENTNGFTGFQKEAMEALLESPIFALTYDTGHDHCIGGTDGPFIRAHASNLRHMHLHDASGHRDHLPLGTGDLEIPRYLSLAEDHRCRVVLETKTIDGLERSVDYLRQYHK